MEMEMEMEMEMVAVEEEYMIGQDLTQPLPPLAYSLLDSTILSHCASCFSLHLPDFPPNPHHVPSSLLYCSPQCSASDSPLHIPSAAHHLQSLPFTYPGDTSDLRAALRLLFHFEKLGFISQNGQGRICGLMSNREKLMDTQREEGNYDVSLRIREGAKAMAAARRKRDGLDFGFDLDLDCIVEETVLCVVLTNAVEVQDKSGRNVGIAVYDTDFSWINHSCSPNAYYLFLQPGSSSYSESRLRIAPAAMGGDGGGGVSNKRKCEFADGCKDYGPRIVVRNIRTIKKGEAVTIAYTDLLQPKAMRQLDLRQKYSFTCQCKRCSAMPLTYVDHALQEIYAVNLHSLNKSFLQNWGNEKLTDFMDDAISEYQSYGDAESCCEKLETVLTDGLLLDELSETNEEIFRLKIGLHPLHHLSLNAYTVLASAYKVRASDLLAKNPKTAENCLYAFRMIRISAAYALLLASLSHQLFLSESSLVASVANFWTGAGESLLNLSRSSMWNNMFAKCQFSVSEFATFHGYKCSKCALLNNFEATFTSSETHNSEFEDICRKFLDCITSRMPEVWNFLVQDNSYLGMVTDPIDIRLREAMYVSAKFLDCKGRLGSRDMKMMSSRCKEEQAAVEERSSIFHLGVHCLLYGGFLSGICGGKDSYSVCYVQRLLYVEDT